DVVADVEDRIVGNGARERRHRASAPVQDAGQDCLAVAAIEPVTVGEIRSAQCYVASRASGVACRAVLDEQHSARAQRLWVGGDGFDRLSADAFAQRRFELAVCGLVACELVVRGPAESAFERTEAGI